MSAHQVTLKPISEVAKYKRNLIPANIPEIYALKPIFKKIASEENIRNGVLAFRSFVYLFCDRLITDGHLYAKPPKKPSGMTDYSFMHDITNLLVDIGYHGKLAKSGDSLRINEIPLCTASINENGKKESPKISASSQIECFRFLTLCGFIFTGINLKLKTLNISKNQPLEVFYPNNPILLTGLKALALADMELRTTRRYWNDHNLLRCDYRLMKAENTDILDELKDFLHPLSEKVKKFAVKLHQRYIDIGLTCTLSILDDVSFSYAKISKSQKELSSREKYQKRVWAFSYSIRNGYCLFVRAKKIDKCADVIKNFPPSLQEKIAVGYGCYRKLGRKYCQGDCQGICISLDESILSISENIEAWLDNEV
ncbi:MAG: hypothetical protein FWE09_00915 [Treponema sp.]|nr:hypothetical protein [Treponema sp.]